MPAQHAPPPICTTPLPPSLSIIHLRKEWTRKCHDWKNRKHNDLVLYPPIPSDCRWWLHTVFRCQGAGRMEDTMKSIMAAQRPNVLHHATKPPWSGCYFANHEIRFVVFGKSRWASGFFDEFHQSRKLWDQHGPTINKSPLSIYSSTIVIYNPRRNLGCEWVPNQCSYIYCLVIASRSVGFHQTLKLHLSTMSTCFIRKVALQGFTWRDKHTPDYSMSCWSLKPFKCYINLIQFITYHWFIVYHHSITEKTRNTHDSAVTLPHVLGYHRPPVRTKGLFKMMLTRWWSRIPYLRILRKDLELKTVQWSKEDIESMSHVRTLRRETKELSSIIRNIILLHIITHYYPRPVAVPNRPEKKIRDHKRPHRSIVWLRPATSCTTCLLRLPRYPEMVAR